MQIKFLRLAGLMVGGLIAGCANLPAAGGGTQAASGNVLSGRAYALDGDSLVLAGERLNLWGIDAPDFGNAHGWYARAALDDLIGQGGNLVCTIKRRSSSTDRALCSNSRSGDVALAMLRGGWAIVTRTERRFPGADTALLDAYEEAEREARRRRAGLWGLQPGR